MENPRVRIHLLPGGIMPERKSKDAAGYDVSIRAIVSPVDRDPKNPQLRKTLFDFETTPEDPILASHIVLRQQKNVNGHELVYRLCPQESIFVGVGFIVEMPPPLFYWLIPRSGIITKWGITITNAPSIVDADYRGEAGVLVYNRNSHNFDIRRNMRIAQIIFQWAVFPNFIQVENYDDLSNTPRGIEGLGSTGLQ